MDKIYITYDLDGVQYHIDIYEGIYQSRSRIKWTIEISYKNNIPLYWEGGRLNVLLNNETKWYPLSSQSILPPQVEAYILKYVKLLSFS